MAIVAIATIALAVAFLVAAIVDIVRTVRSAKAESDKPLRDPKDCDHEWMPYDSGSCMPSYSSYGGPDPQETWTVEHCPRCGSRQFSCTGTGDCYSECAAPYEG